MKCCNGDCNQGRDCEDQPLLTFDDIVGFARDILAGVGILAVIVAIGFWSAR